MLKPFDSDSTLSEVLCLNPLGFHKMRYRTYGNSNAPIIFMIHGLTRCGQDFSTLARSLSDKYFVVCPDVVGRGDSDWLPMGVNYGYSQYLADLNVLINAIWGLTNRTLDHERKIMWVGTSMGGLLGMILASLSNTPIQKLILNDIGPSVAHTSLVKMKDTFAITPVFNSLDETLPYLKKIYAGFGDLTTEQWLSTAEYMFKKQHDGAYTVHYDPRITDFSVGDDNANGATASTQNDVLFWPYWMMINCPIYVVRGSESSFLPHDLLVQMQQTKPGMQTHVVPRAAHAPALVDSETIQIISSWINN